MAYCRHCGKSIDNNALTCPYCGKPQYNTNQNSFNQYSNNRYSGYQYGGNQSGNYQHNNYQYGNNQYGNNQYRGNRYRNGPYPGIDRNDKYSFGWGFLSFLFPIIGIIYFIVKRKTNPKKAKSAIIGAIVSIVINVIYYIFAMSIGLLDYSVYTDAYDTVVSATEAFQI